MKIIKTSILLLLFLSLQGCGTVAYVAGKAVGTTMKAGVDAGEMIV